VTSRKPQVRARAEEARRRLEERRDDPAVDAALRTLRLQDESGGGLLAGAIAFRFFLFIVPFVFVVVMGLGLGADATGTDLRDVARQAGITGVAAVAVESGATATTGTRWVTFGLAVIALVLGARNFVKAVWVAHALVWRVPLRRPAHATVLGFAFIGVALAATLLLRLTYVLRAASVIGWVTAVVFFTAVVTGGWMLCVQRLLPGPAGRTWRDVLPGALLFGVGAQVLQLVTVLWIAPSTQSKSETYGAIGAALTILLWAYILGWLLTSSAALDATLWRRSTGAS
jgi:uncharacterized BrkB/YihY/UPF0761 family membrane protein